MQAKDVPQVKLQIDDVLALAALLPEEEEVFFGVSQFSLYASNAEDLIRLRTILKIARTWKKTPPTNVGGSWAYSVELGSGLEVVIRCFAAPPTCKLVEKEVQVEKTVIANQDAVRYEKKLVTETVKEWVCS